MSFNGNKAIPSVFVTYSSNTFITHGVWSNENKSLTFHELKDCGMKGKHILLLFSLSWFFTSVLNIAINDGLNVDSIIWQHETHLNIDE